MTSETGTQNPLPTEFREKLSKPTMTDEDVDNILEKAESDGAIVYEKDKGSKDMSNDRFAHAALLNDGVTGIEVLAETSGNKNIDLRIDGMYVEVKSPTSSGNKKDQLRIVGDNLRTARHQFRGSGRTSEADTKVVFNGRYCRQSDVGIFHRIEEEMTRQHIAYVAQVLKNGQVYEHFKPQN